MEVAAACGFWHFTITQCRLLGGLIGVQMPRSGSSLFEVVFALATAVLSDKRDDEVLELLAARFSRIQNDTNYEEFMEIDDAYNIMSREDEKEFKDEAKAQKQRSDTLKSFRLEWGKKVGQARGARARSKAGKAAARTKRLKGYKGPSTLPSGLIPQNQIRGFLPPGCPFGGITTHWVGAASASRSVVAQSQQPLTAIAAQPCGF